jgi:hypothetical protein
MYQSIEKIQIFRIIIPLNRMWWSYRLCTLYNEHIFLKHIAKRNPKLVLSNALCVCFSWWRLGESVRFGGTYYWWNLSVNLLYSVCTQCTENSIYVFLQMKLRTSSQFLHSSICERFIYSHDRSSFLAAAKQDIYIEFSPALHLQCSSLIVNLYIL